MRRLMAAAIIMVMSCGLTSAHASTTSNLKAINLGLKDMPSGFTVSSQKTSTNAQAAKGDHMTVAQEN